MVDTLLAFTCIVSGLTHLAGGAYILRRGYRFSGWCFLVGGVALIAFVVALVLNGAPGGCFCCSPLDAWPHAGAWWPGC